MSRHSATRMTIEEAFSDIDLNIVEKRPTRWWGNFLAFFALFPICGVAAILLSIYPAAGAIGFAKVAQIPIDYWNSLHSELPEVELAEQNVFYDINGNEFARVWSQNRIPLDDFDEISTHAVNALVAAEDKRFWDVGVFDILGTARAAIRNEGGGSGISQQLVKNLMFYNISENDVDYNPTEQTWERKVQELKYAVDLNKKYTKQEIITMYFNTVAIGAPNIYSLEAASQHFFGVHASELTLAQASGLVATIQNSAQYDMRKLTTREAQFSSDWKKRQAYVLNRMEEDGYITKAERESALGETLEFTLSSPSGNCYDSSNPAYCEYVVSYLETSPALGNTPEERAAALQKGGMEIYTYFDPHVTNLIQNRVSSDLGNDNRVVMPAAVVQPSTGGVLGIAWNRDFGEGEGQSTINFALNESAPGSTFKMLTMVAALNAGMTENDLKFSSRCPFRPEGFEYPSNGFRNQSGCGFQAGYLTSQTATAYSSNTWFLTLATKIGMDAVLEQARVFGMNIPESISNRSLSYVIGSVEQTPVNMAAMYATFANDGVFCAPLPVKEIVSGDREILLSPETVGNCTRVLSSENNQVVMRALRANTVPGYVGGAFGLRNYIPGYDTAGKSGTNEKFNFAWAQISGLYSMYITAYDPVNFTEGVSCNTIVRGARICSNFATLVGGDLMRDLLSGTENVPLDFGDAWGGQRRR